MGYTALKDVKIPELSNARNLTYAQEALRFIREDCQDLKFKTDDIYLELKDLEGKSCKHKGDHIQIPYNMERDLDRLCLEKAITRFVHSGSRSDAFDVYYCYCEIFQPFGGKSESARVLLELMGEHESNASYLLTKHRDHYVHSVNVFLTGLAVYKNLKGVREAYMSKYDLTREPESAYHFLEYWGFTSLFHDIGYPFEIAHQQIKSYLLSTRNYIATLTKEEEKKANKDSILPNDFPAVSYAEMNRFMSRDDDLKIYLGNDNYDIFLTDLMKEGLEPEYIRRVGLPNTKWEAFCDAGIFQSHIEKSRQFMDHAYFSALLLTKAIVKSKKNCGDNTPIDSRKQDCLCAILLHNSLFNRVLRNKHWLNTAEPLKLSDGMPLTYLLMLCDELQSWHRMSYGHDTRRNLYPIDFDILFANDIICMVYYYYDEAFGSDMPSSADFTKKSFRKVGEELLAGSDFMGDIAKIISLQDVFGRSDSDDNCADLIWIETKKMDMSANVNLSTGSYMNLYNLAVGVFNHYEKNKSDIEAVSFEDDLSLEYKLSNIAQAKGFADRLHSVGCFYTDEFLALDIVHKFNEIELRRIAESEHNRWCSEKMAMGWRPDDMGEVSLIKDEKKQKEHREKVRKHPALVPFEELSAGDKQYNMEAMQELIKLLRTTEGLLVYRF